MYKINGLIYYLFHPYRFYVDMVLKHPTRFSDKIFLKVLYRHLMGEKQNLENPQKFTEKIQWLVLPTNVH